MAHKALTSRVQSLRIALLLVGCLAALPARTAEPPPRIAPGPVIVHTKLADKDKPVAGVLVRFGGRYATTAADGLATLDGVPAGTYPLVIHQLGFEHYEKTVTLPAGKREPIEVVLAPVVQASVNGQVRLDDLDRPLPGARVALVPAAVPAAVQGRLDWVTSWDGKFSVLEIPPGQYRADVSAPGCLAKSFPVEVKPGMADLQLKLPRETQPASLKVTVQDAVTGKPVKDARVFLAEAWPKGKLGDVQTDGQGQALFRDLKLGRLNWADEKDLLTASRRQCTVRVEAAGYESTLALVALDANAAATVPINPTTKIVVEKPAGSQETAEAIRTGTPVEFKIATVGDKHFFRFRLKSPAYLKMTLGPKNVLATQMTLLGPGGKKWPKPEYKDRENVLELGVPAGEYFLQVEQWGNIEANDTPLTLMVASTTAADALEPNDSAQAARLLQSGEEARGCLLPVGDVDHYRFEMKRPGMVRFTMPAHPLARRLVIRNEVGTEVASQNAYPNQPLELVTGLQAGNYVIEAHQWGDNAESTEPYTLRFEAAEDDGSDDPPEQPGRLSAVRTQPPTGLVGSTINPIKDVDRYAVALPSSGLLQVHALAPIALQVRVRGADGKELALAHAYPKQPADLTWSAPGPITVYLEVRQWGDNDWSASPYVLRTFWQPCDELEFLGRNDTPETATPFEPGTVLRGNVVPVGDVDFYRLAIDHPGYLQLEGVAPLGVAVTIYDARRKRLEAINAYPNQAFQLGADVLAGDCLAEVRAWNPADAHPAAYAIRTRLHRAEPMERPPLADDPVRPLQLGEGQPYVIDQIGDRDRFSFSLPQAGKFTVRVRTPLETTLRIFDDRSGAKEHESNHYARMYDKFELEAKGPTRYRLEVTKWGDNGRSAEPGYILVDSEGRDLVVETVSATADPFDPTLVTFTRKAIEGLAGADKVQIDADGDGKGDLDLSGTATKTWRYSREGVYAATAFLEGKNGTKTIGRLWVEAVGARERRGIVLLVDQPVEGQVVEREQPCRVRAISYTGVRIDRVALTVDGRPLTTAYSAPFDLEVPWRTLGQGKHVLAFTATDLRGESATLQRTVEISEYFGLLPDDGAVLSGNEVRISWTGTAFGPGKVRYRLRGTTDWKEAVGESGRERVVVLSGLEAGKVYEFQPLGAGEPGPLRTVTRVKGLAFGRSRYGATIARDYDQRLGISVRNDSDKAMVVRLECGQPSDNALLVGFVGDGSEGAPFSLRPGEEREFLLGLSAQDVVTPTHRFPIRIASENGFADEAEVEVNVKLPAVKLKWEALGPTPNGLGQRFRLHNQGDTLTDLEIISEKPGVNLSPAVRHGLFSAGATLEVTAHPRLYDGFKGIETRLIARAVGQSAAQDFKVAFKDDQKLFAVPLMPGYDPEAKGTPDSDLLRARSLAGAQLNPAAVDWSQKRSLEAGSDGRVSRWSVFDRREQVLWIGEDTDGDGEIDFVHADLGGNGRFDYSAYKVGDRWTPTNLVEAWLEVTFKLPWARDQYEKHNVDIVLNGQVVGRLRDVIPEGNYTFRVPPRALKLGSGDAPGDNKVEIQSQHLRGGHYVISSDFRLKLRLTGMQVWTVAPSAAEARQRAQQTAGLALNQPDYSVSAIEVRIDGPAELKPGTDVLVTVPLRNLGASRTERIPVALVASTPGQPGAEVSRQNLEHVPLTGSTLVRLPWKVAAGTHTLKVVVDPDGKLPDSDRANNEALLTLTVAGEVAKPTLKLLEPSDGAVLKDTVFKVRAETGGDASIFRVELQIDNGLAKPLKTDPKGNVHSGEGLLQPGDHVLTIRATAGSGQYAEHKVRVRVDAPAPEVQIVEPAEGKVVAERQSPVKLKVGKDTALAAVRLNGGPWRRLPLKDGTGEATLTLPFGPVKLEALAVNARGAARLLSANLSCGKQPLPDEPREPGSLEPGVLEIEGLGPVDLFGPLNTLVEPKKLQGRLPARGPPFAASVQTAVVSILLPAVIVPPSDPSADCAGLRLPPGENGLVVVQTRTSDWYCTNRPQIAVGFQVPELPNAPPPGSKAYDEAAQKLLAGLRDKGFRTDALEKFYQALLNRAGQLEQPQNLPEGLRGFLTSLGVLEPPAADPESLKQWRAGVVEKLQAYWLRLLATQDPVLIAEGLRQRLDAFRQFDEAVQLAAQAAIASQENSFPDIPRDEAIRRSGLVPKHAEAISTVAKARNEIVLTRPVSKDATPLIAAGLPTKSMHIKGKSSDWGAQAGYIPVNQFFSKMGNQDDPEGPMTPEKRQEIEKYNREVRESIDQGYAIAKPLRSLEGRPVVIVREKSAVVERGIPRVVEDLGGGRYRDPKSKKEWTQDQLVGDKEPFEVLASVEGKQNFLTADYDLLAHGTREPQEEPEFDRDMGYVTKKQRILIRDLNTAVEKTGYDGGKVVHHGPESQFPDSPGVDYPVTAFEPDGKIVSIENERWLKEYFHRKRDEGWHLPHNPKWWSKGGPCPELE